MKQVPVKGMAHITGGGLVDNVPRVLPEGLSARLNRSSWQMPMLFQWLQQQGQVADEEMYRVFNCGVGFIVVVDQAHVATALNHLKAQGLESWELGVIEAQGPGMAPTRVL
jgi:phosphoribosylformylglycinamidine cyclo-ligase